MRLNGNPEYELTMIRQINNPNRTQSYMLNRGNLTMDMIPESPNLRVYCTIRMVNSFSNSSCVSHNLSFNEELSISSPHSEHCIHGILYIKDL